METLEVHFKLLFKEPTEIGLESIFALKIVLPKNKSKDS